jgi:uncharacterized membrane protein
MVLGAFRDGMYDLMLLLHIIAVIIAFSPVSSNPLFLARFRNEDAATRQRVAAAMHKNGRTVFLPALIAIPILGFALVGMSGDNGFEFKDGWVGAAVLVWIAIAGLVTGLIMPGERKMAEGDESAEKRVALGGQIVTVLLVVILWLMIFKPGA